MYYIFVFFLIFFAFIQSRSSLGQEYKSRILLLVFTMFFSTSGLRYENGADYFSYKELYDQTNTLIDAINYHTFSFDRNAEVGYMFISSFFKTLNCNINVMYFFISIFSSYLLFNSFFIYNKNYFYLCLLIYFSFVYFVIDMSAVRQCLSISIFAYSIRFILLRKPVAYFALILAASLFHYSAMILFPFYWLLNIKLSNQFVFISVSLAFIICLFKIKFVELFVGSIASFLWGDIAYKLFVYGVESQKIWGMNPKVALQIVILLLLFIYRNRIKDFYPYLNIIINLFYFYILLRLLLWESIDMNSRFGYYFIFGMILGMPLLIDLLKRRSNRMVCLSVIVLFTFYQCQSYLLENISTITYNPYQNYLIHTFFDRPNTGEERFRIHKNVNED